MAKGFWIWIYRVSELKVPVQKKVYMLANRRKVFNILIIYKKGLNRRCRFLNAAVPEFKIPKEISDKSNFPYISECYQYGTRVAIYVNRYRI
jgi:hypothetical protein